MKNKQHRKLDEVLKFFVTKEHVPINEVEEKTIEAMDENFKEKTSKLIKDGYIAPNNNVHNNGFEYLVTFEGRIFFEKGGYVNELRVEKRKQYMDLIHQWILTIGSGLAGIYVVFEIVCYFLEKYNSV